MCSKVVVADDIELHLVICLTKPRISYNGKLLSKKQKEKKTANFSFWIYRKLTVVGYDRSTVSLYKQQAAVCFRSDENVLSAQTICNLCHDVSCICCKGSRFKAWDLWLFLYSCSTLTVHYYFFFRLEKERDSLFIFRRSNLRCHYKVTYHFYQDDSVRIC